jgi:hypothetical protein
MKFKFDWRSIDCSKMPDYEVKKPGDSFWYDDNFWERPHIDSDKFWSTSDCELIPKHCYIKFIKGFDVSQKLINCTEEVANGTR